LGTGSLSTPEGSTTAIIAEESGEMSHFTFDDMPYVPVFTRTDVITGDVRGADEVSDDDFEEDSTQPISVTTATRSFRIREKLRFNHLVRNIPDCGRFPLLDTTRDLLRGRSLRPIRDPVTDKSRHQCFL
jgi:hypothetical protein